MKTPLAIALLLTLPVAGLAQQLLAPEPLREPATTVFRQVLPDGRIIYSDKAQQGAKIDQTLRLEAPPQGSSTWSVEGGTRPAVPARAEPTPVRHVASIPPPGRKKTTEEADSEVIRAEMLLEDARRKRDAGHPARPEELGETGPDSAYANRQKALAQQVSQAEAMLKQALEEREALRRRR